MPVVKFVLFLGITIVVSVVSWRSLSHPHSHGFYRFFAWEFIAGLLVLNLSYWFIDPFSWNQCISWAFLFASLVPVTMGTYALKSKGKASAQRESEPQLLPFEKTTLLITTGIFRYIRHPLYSSLLLLTWGIFFKWLTWLGIVLALSASITLYLTAKADEAECITFFGPMYREYMKKTKMFIPGIF